MTKDNKKQSIKNIKEKSFQEILLQSKLNALYQLGKRIFLTIKSYEKYEEFPKNLFHKLDWEKYRNENSIILHLKSRKDRLVLEDNLDFIEEYLNKENLKDKHNFSDLGAMCIGLSKYNYKHLNEKDLIKFDAIERNLLSAACEEIGYWKAKLEEKMRNQKGGANTKKRLGAKNKEAIGIIINELRIKSFTLFKKDKKLRNLFFEKVKEKTGLTSENRIFVIGRECIKEKATP